METTSINKIGIVGTGKAAQFFAHYFQKNKYVLTGFCGSGSERGKEVASRLQVNYVDTPEALLPADMILLAVPDSIIQEIAAHIPHQKNTLVVHCSGATPLSVLSQHPQRGVLYPLQSLHSMGENPLVPLLIEASSDKSFQLLEAVARDISSIVNPCDSEMRPHYHLSAVFLNNFVTHIHILAKDYLKDKGLDPKLVQPLIEHTMGTLLQAADAQLLQTGPAVRKDHVTLALHAELLRSNPQLFSVYQQLSDSISNKNIQ